MSYTFYHLLQALSLGQPITSATQVMVTDVGLDRDLCRAFESRGIRIVPGRYGLNGWQHRIKTRTIAAALKRIVNDVSPQELVFGSDLVPDAQATMAWIKRRNPSTIIGLIEDGIGLYLPPINQQLGAARRLARRIAYGRHFQRPPGVGRSQIVDRIYASRPSLVTWKPARKLMITAGAAKTVTEALAEAGTPVPRLSQGSTILLGPNPSNKMYHSQFRAMVAFAKDSPGDVWFKAHPRDTSSPPRDFHVLPAVISAEILAAANRGGLRRIVTTPSTPLYSVPDLAPSCEVYIVNDLPTLDPLLYSLAPYAKIFRTSLAGSQTL